MNSHSTLTSVPSEHIEAAVIRMFDAGWMRRITWATDAPFSSRYFPLDIESERDPDVTYRVVYDDDAKAFTCTCPAGMHDRRCKHAELVKAWLGLRGIR